MSQTQDVYALIAGGFDARVQTTRADQWDASSPCEEWKARDVVGHVVNNHRRLMAEVEGSPATDMGADEDPKAAWSDAFARMTALNRDPVAREKNASGPMGPTPLGQLLETFVTMDMLIHTWDLARAVGGDESLDADSVHRAYEMVTPMDAMIRQPGIFGPKIDPPADADEQTSLLHFLGRKA